jgi:hypothetical protein
MSLLTKNKKYWAREGRGMTDENKPPKSAKIDQIRALREKRADDRDTKIRDAKKLARLK